MTDAAARSATTSFDLLHAAVQHHIVNTLGWRSLRPHQDEAVIPILRGLHTLVQAPTAGGKTEAAMLPLLSRMLGEGWDGLSVLYLCPIKALLNNLESRLSRLAGMVGRTVGVWHGDVGQTERKRLLRERPDVLLATPESVEVMLVSRLVDHEQLFRTLRAVVVDEVHAFAGDDRGWHLLALLERLRLLSERPPQRIALSATLANPDDLLAWLTAGADEPRQVVRGSGAAGDADVRLDYVSSLSNAAMVIARLHHGEKRLVFCDSRTQVEELGQAVRTHGVRTFVSHSSLGIDERRRAEEAFAQGSDCVIVATSTLELGLDVGDLDRVIQVDAPGTVASFLQRLGRTGRRPVTRRNCLFLATDEDALIRSAALIRLWSEGFVEPVRPPALPYHVLVQQVMAIILQHGGGIERARLGASLARWLRTAGISMADLDGLVAYLIETDILSTDGPILMLGPEGEERYGARHFLELFSVFNTPPLVTVYHGMEEVGQVHPLSFLRRGDEPPLLALGGRGWRVTYLDWPRKRAWVEPSDYRGKSRWLGDGAPMHFATAQAMARVLREGLDDRFTSQRARAGLEALRAEYEWLEEKATTFIVEPPGAGGRWWSFAGDRYDTALLQLLRAQSIRGAADALGVTVLPSAGENETVLSTEAVREALVAAQRTLVEHGPLAAADDATRALKFADALPDDRLVALAIARSGVEETAAAMVERPVRVRVSTTR